jgi:hypothetical protein
VLTAPAAAHDPGPLDWAHRPEVSASSPVFVMPGPRLTLADIGPGAVVRAPHEPGPRLRNTSPVALALPASGAR